MTTHGFSAGPSPAMLELENLSGLAHHHTQLCNESDCTLSVRMAKQTAERLALFVQPFERNAAQDVLDRWPL